MNLTLYRYRKTSDHIDGHLKSDQGRLCDTVENATSAIPVGKYSISIIKCKQHARKMPVIWVDGLGMKDEGISLNSQLSTLIHKCEHCKKLEFVTNNTSMPCRCPQITPGNGMYNRHDGAIIVGTFNCSGCLIYPKEAFDRVYQLLRKSVERKHEITLTVLEDYPQPRKRELSNYELGTQILNQL